MEIDYAQMEIWNPEDKPLSELPKIFGFNNGGQPGWYDAVAIAQDGYFLGGHLCSSEGFVPYDLGCFKGSRPDRHEKSYRVHYPAGYVMEYVPREATKTHAGILEACRLNALLATTQAAMPKDQGAEIKIETGATA